MLTLNILSLIKQKLIPIKYIIKPQYKYIYNYLNKNIIEIIDLLNLLSIAYLYIYKYTSLKQKILFSTNYIQHIIMLKTISTLTYNYYIYNMHFGIFSNWIFFKKKLIIYKWLRYFFLTNLTIKNNYKNIFYIYYTLYFLYLKLKLKYNGLKNLNNIPNTLIFINLEKNNKYLKEIFKLNKNIIIITNNNLNKFLPINIIKIFIINKNYLIIQFIIKLLTTAIFHGILY